MKEPKVAQRLPKSAVALLAASALAFALAGPFASIPLFWSIQAVRAARGKRIGASYRAMAKAATISLAAVCAFALVLGISAYALMPA